MGRQSALIIACILLVAGCSGREERLSTAEEYPGQWMADAPRDIVMALAKADASRCAEFFYKESVRREGQVLVYCTTDRTDWSVWTVTRSSVDPANSIAVGPFAPEPGITPPAQGY